MKRTYFIIAAVVVIGGAVWVLSKSDKPALPDVPQFELRDYTGKLVTSQDFLGKPLVINSWAVWCPFCVKELSDFAAAQKEFGERIVIIAIDRQEPLPIAKDFTDRLGITQELIFLLDPDDDFYRAIGGFSMPETIFVDREGNIVDHKRGPMEAAEIRERINKIID